MPTRKLPKFFEDKFFTTEEVCDALDLGLDDFPLFLYTEIGIITPLILPCGTYYLKSEIREKLTSKI